MSNVKSESYDTARQYMICLDPEDFELDERLAQLASITKLSSREFQE
ncbi:MAG: hypothetical protein GKS05_01195 [Nitrospirales bacterium]|nr:hypothetical protein [Nitrospirales bacterium]